MHVTIKTIDSKEVLYVCESENDWQDLQRSFSGARDRGNLFLVLLHKFLPNEKGDIWLNVNTIISVSLDKTKAYKEKSEKSEDLSNLNAAKATVGLSGEDLREYQLAKQPGVLATEKANEVAEKLNKKGIK